MQTTCRKSISCAGVMPGREITWLAQFQPGQIPGSLEETEVDAASVEVANILIDLLLREE